MHQIALRVSTPEWNAVCQWLNIAKIIVYLEKGSFEECGKQTEQIPVIMFKWFIGGIQKTENEHFLA